MTKTLSPQAETVLAHMETHGSITQREALLDLRVQSLTRRITELRNAGHKIVRDDRIHKTTGQRYARYFLKDAV